MKSFPIFAILAALLVIGGATLFLWSKDDGGQIVALEPHNVAITMSGREVYAEHCASCHGINLEGQPNWRQRDHEARNLEKLLCQDLGQRDRCRQIRIVKLDILG